MTNRRQLVEDIFKNFHLILHKMKAKEDNSRNPSRITPSQWFVLGIIRRCKNSSVKNISEMLGTSSSAATQLVDGLVKNGYVKRRDNPKDHRLIQLELSPKGKKQIAVMKKRRINRLAKLFDALSDSELETCLRLNKKIASRFLDKKSKHDSSK